MESCQALRQTLEPCATTAEVSVALIQLAWSNRKRIESGDEYQDDSEITSGEILLMNRRVAQSSGQRQFDFTPTLHADHRRIQRVLAAIGPVAHARSI
jgi:hypothetical protein